jgi:phage terminase large subunit-like protein
MIAPISPDIVTQRWMRDASDELAVREGCWFDEARGQFAVDWMYDYLRLYEGESAGQPFECCKDWQYEGVMRLFGWVRQSEDWGRVIRRFRKASWWVAKKNKKSPTLAAVTCYVAFGDGEMGQKCFPTAKDGVQIKENVVRHIHEMVRQSDQLNSECKVYKNTGVVFHHPTRSLIMPLSSDNVASQKAKEGLNGSVFVDEVHVVDKQHMRRLSRAGISRPEPIQLEVSTAGDEPESYGKARFDYACAVADGRQKDIETLALIYAAPQDVSDADIHADPMKYGQMANPAMGHTVKPSEYMADYNSSKASLSEFADFKKYRLNIWQQSANPWISVHDWGKCRMEEGPLPEGAHTVAAFDLSQTTDFTAWVMFQPDDEAPRCYGHYWITEKRARELSAEHEINILEWVRDGWVTLSTDETINYKQVHKQMAADIEKYHIGLVGLDRAYSGCTVQYLADDQGIELVQIAQGAMSLSSPSKELEALVIDGKLDSRCDPVMAWMIGNTSVKRDENDNIKPVKTVGGVRKHIDGVVSLVMAVLTSMLHPDGGRSIYETPGSLAL